MQLELGEVIFERQFKTRDANGNVGQVTLRVGKPQSRTEDGREFWYCPHQLIGAASKHVRTLRGVDALDALFLTLKLARFELDSYARRYHKKITWLGEDWLGLPEFEVSDEAKDDFAGFQELYEEYFGGFDK